jgi:hypothetical protein
VGCFNVCLAPHGITGGEDVGTEGTRDRREVFRWAPWSICVGRQSWSAAEPPEFLGRETKRPIPCPAWLPASGRGPALLTSGPGFDASLASACLGPGQAELPSDLRWLDANLEGDANSVHLSRRQNERRPPRSAACPAAQLTRRASYRVASARRVPPPATLPAAMETARSRARKDLQHFGLAADDADGFLGPQAVDQPALFHEARDHGHDARRHLAGADDPALPRASPSGLVRSPSSRPPKAQTNPGVL